MSRLRAIGSALLSRGVLTPGWYAILTGLAMLVVAHALGTVADDDPAAAYVAVGMAVLGIWQLERGVRAELARWPRPTAVSDHDRA
ncbi:hypothetical protein [Nocardioides dongkuii]|uniref:hypothetical protein n=1 Tax=Nocardioides dongkuii TaxID=2760089 RepID=UPI0015F97D69|nr:hypothetical protein [Nocardioides dongkuii]